MHAGLKNRVNSELDALRKQNTETYSFLAFFVCMVAGIFLIFGSLLCLEATEQVKGKILYRYQPFLDRPSRRLIVEYQQDGETKRCEVSGANNSTEFSVDHSVQIWVSLRFQQRCLLEYNSMELIARGMIFSAACVGCLFTLAATIQLAKRYCVRQSLVKKLEIIESAEIEASLRV